MQILLWLVPPVVVTVVAMAWVGWLGRAGRGVVDRDEAVRRLGAALDREPRVTAPSARAPRFRSTGVAVRRPAPEPCPDDVPLAPVVPAGPAARRAEMAPDGHDDRLAGRPEQRPEEQQPDPQVRRRAS